MASGTSVLVHNCQVDYDSGGLATEAFEARLNSGFWGTDHNVAVASVTNANGETRLVHGFSNNERHAEEHILSQLGDDDTIGALYTERQPCPGRCAPALASDPRAAGAHVTWSMPYADPATPEGRLLNQAWTDQLGGWINAARGRRGLPRMRF